MDEQLEMAILMGAGDEDIELLLLHNIIGVNNGEPNNEGVPFNMDNYTDEQVKTNFRFLRNDIIRLRNSLQIPEEIVTENGNRTDGLTALCMLLRRLSYPNRLADLKFMFNCSEQSLSQFIKTMTAFIVETHGQQLERLASNQWLNANRFRQYAQSIAGMGGAIPNCWAFIDGTIRQICRPGVDQEEYYSGHKKVHCLKYQSLLTPDGLIINLMGAWPGRRHDAGMFRESNLYQQLEQNCILPNNENFVIFGDQAYGLRPLLLSPFPGHPANLLPHEEAFNASMKVLRVAVEWGFQKVISQFAFVDFKKNQKLLLSDVESLYKSAVILTNCHSCFYGNQTSEYFNVEPPNLEEYMG